MGKLIRALGVLITIASIAVGIWLQILFEVAIGGNTRVDRAYYALVAMAAVGIGLIVIGVGQMLVLREAKSN